MAGNVAPSEGVTRAIQVAVAGAVRSLSTGGTPSAAIPSYMPPAKRTAALPATIVVPHPARLTILIVDMDVATELGDRIMEVELEGVIMEGAMAEDIVEFMTKMCPCTNCRHTFTDEIRQKYTHT